MSPDLVRSFVNREWTTHVRELVSLLWTCVDESKGDYVELAEVSARPSTESKPLLDESSLPDNALRALVALREADGVQDRAWRALGMTNRFQLQRLVKKYDLKKYL